ncbi:NACHT, LRR and PYD domains-containing protein 5-like [Sparus aurata]|uniref:NACHT, LRR and PYD domains-containing protein 5-like n=1 Tax=Sparus aurata TaxID=8175 RepID=UPI0011C17123|nr:NACHT, LRR and PYD domains-containing protein 5-like [Sparus aurata]
MATPVRTSSPGVQGDPGPFEEDRSVSPVPSNVSMRSDRSKDEPLHLKMGELSPFEEERSVSPVDSLVSMKSDGSKDEPLHFRMGELSPFEEDRPVSPVDSLVSMKSDGSKAEPLHFRKGELRPFEEDRPVSPVDSLVSMRSDRSKAEPLHFSKEQLELFEEDRPVSPVDSSVSMRSDKSKAEPLHFRKVELSSPDQNPDTTMPSSEDTSSQGKAVSPKLTADLKRQILSQHEEEVKNLKTDTELYEIGEENRDKTQTYDELFQKSGTETVQTVLMTGVPHVGKTLQTRRFMVDWAEGKSNNNIDLIVSLKFSELNSRKDEEQSMTDLLRHSLNDDEHPEVCKFDDCEVAFVLDGLEECELPLNFENNEDLTDMDKPASMDVLLTNLIKGNLLPSARLWIVSQPSGVDKIPSEYIQKQTECRGKDFKHELTADLKKTIHHQHEEELRELETDTELYEIGEEHKVQTYDGLFQKSATEKVRTVLMKGVPRVGKTFKTRRFMVDWAQGKSNKNTDLIVSLKFTELNSRENKVQSMTDLIRDSINDNKYRLACQYNKCEVAFVLDGLEECELPLDFENNEDLTDMDKPASIDVLLTNLIKGKLLPSARLWIVAQPSGVDKIPSEYIQKQTECRETLKRRQQLVSALRKRFLTENTEVENKIHPYKKNTEHIIREEKKIQKGVG